MKSGLYVLFSFEYYYFGGQLLATRNPSSLAWNDYIYAGNGLITENVGAQSALPSFRLGDHLDSLAETTDSMGDPSGTNDFTPYGQVVQGTAQSLIQFTDHESDSESGTDHTLYRQLSPAQSRWTRPDPANSSYNLYDPQTFNRYAYLSNRPNNGIDALGLDGGNGCGLVCTIGVDAGIGAIIAGFEGVFGGGGHSDLPGVQTAPSTTDTTASDSSTAGAGSDGDPAWDKPILNEQLGLPPNIARQLGSGGFLGALGLGSDSCEFGACGSGLTQVGQADQTANGPQFPYLPPYLPQNRNVQGRQPGPPTRNRSPRQVPDPRQTPGTPMDEPPPTNTGKFFYSLLQILRAINNNLDLPGGFLVFVGPEALCQVDRTQPYCSHNRL